MPTLIVTAEGEGSRLDRYLRRQQFYFPQNLFEKWSRQGKLRLNDEKAKASSRLHTGDKLTFPDDAVPQAPPEIPTLIDLSYVDAKKHIDSMRIFEDDSLLVLNKPTGLATQGGTGQRISVDSILQAYSPKQKLRLTHRIDRETSGILVIAKTLSAATEVTNEFRLRQAKKTYIAICHGVFTRKSGVVDSPIGKDEDDFERMSSNKGTSYSRDALTYYKVISEKNKLTLVELSPETGRTHQLRVHMASLEHPILGDKKYGGRPHTRLMLHAWRITILGQVFEAPIPTEFQI